MHSNLAEDLKLLELGWYFGLMNSAMSPWVFSKVALYSGIENTRQLVFPGNNENPWELVGSGPENKDWIWLYSTFIVILELADCSSQIAPIASPGYRGIVIEFISRFLDCEMPNTEGRERNTKG